LKAMVPAVGGGGVDSTKPLSREGKRDSKARGHAQTELREKAGISKARDKPAPLISEKKRGPLGRKELGTTEKAAAFQPKEKTRPRGRKAMGKTQLENREGRVHPKKKGRFGSEEKKQLERLMQFRAKKEKGRCVRTPRLSRKEKRRGSREDKAAHLLWRKGGGKEKYEKDIAVCLSGEEGKERGRDTKEREPAPSKRKKKGRKKQHKTKKIKLQVNSREKSATREAESSC